MSRPMYFKIRPTNILTMRTMLHRLTLAGEVACAAPALFRATGMVASELFTAAPFLCRFDVGLIIAWFVGGGKFVHHLFRWGMERDREIAEPPSALDHTTAHLL